MATKRIHRHALPAFIAICLYSDRRTFYVLYHGMLDTRKKYPFGDNQYVRAVCVSPRSVKATIKRWTRQHGEPAYIIGENLLETVEPQSTQRPRRKA